jgi:suppressor of ftsI
VDRVHGGADHVLRRRCKIKGYAYQGNYIGPTLRVNPGDTVRINLTNGLGQPTNLHGHGMFMSPIGISDNVLRVMKSDTFNHVVWKLPTDIEPGTYWYHSHLHGLVEPQIFAGLSGVLIVDGLEQLLPPELQTIQQHVVALKDLQVKDGAILTKNIDSNAPTTRTVNGQVDPGLSVQTNQTQMLRLANIGADIWYRLRLSGTQFTVIAQDANPVAQVWTADELVLPPGKRYDVLVRWPQPGTQSLENPAVQHRAQWRQLPPAASYDSAGQRRRGSGCRVAHFNGAAVTARYRQGRPPDSDALQPLHRRDRLPLPNRVSRGQRDDGHHRHH